MTRILVGNFFNEELRDDRRWAGWWVLRLAWFAKDGDVLVVPVEPTDFFLDYVTSFTGTSRATLKVVVPPPGHAGVGLLTADRLRHPAFLDALMSAVGGRRVDEIIPLWPDAAMTRLARALGREPALAGAGFLGQGGGALVNSKVVFRAVAGGAGVPIPEGAVCSGPDGAEEALVELLDAGHPAILKQEFLSGGRGNEIVTPVEGIRPIGARRAVVARGRAAVKAYLAESWDWLTGGGHNPVVVERYFRDSGAYFSEFRIDDDKIELGGTGELLSAPFAAGQIFPAVGLAPETVEALVEGGHRLSIALHAMGYRGVLSADAIVTPTREVLFTEWNGRVTGSTHVYEVIGKQVVGPGFGSDRVILERVGLKVPSFEGAVELLRSSGLAYDRATRTGVVICSALNEAYSVVHYCVVAADLDAAWERERELRRLFPEVRA